jgi:hypothetical protein
MCPACVQAHRAQRGSRSYLTWAPHHPTAGFIDRIRIPAPVLKACLSSPGSMQKLKTYIQHLSSAEWIEICAKGQRPVRSAQRGLCTRSYAPSFVLPTASRASRRSSCAFVTRFWACVSDKDVRHSSETLASQARRALSSCDCACSSSSFAFSTRGWGITTSFLHMMRLAFPERSCPACRIPLRISTQMTPYD